MVMDKVANIESGTVGISCIPIDFSLKTLYSYSITFSMITVFKTHKGYGVAALSIRLSLVELYMLNIFSVHNIIAFPETITHNIPFKHLSLLYPHFGVSQILGVYKRTRFSQS
jgi:hypothetical protein